jgi:tetratricopeptide (TPR) repeat protein
MDLGTPMRGCTESFFFACAACFLKAVDNGGSFEVKPLPSTEQKQQERVQKSAEHRLALLQRFSAKHFNLAPVLDCGIITCPRTDRPEVARYVKRGVNGALCPLADPYDYYARAAILYSMAHICSTPNQRDQVLHEVLVSCVNQPLHETIKMIKTSVEKSEIDRRSLIATLEAEQAAVNCGQLGEMQARERVVLHLKACDASLLKGIAVGLLREAREAIVTALQGGDSGPNRLAQQQFGFARAHNPRAEYIDTRSRDEKAAADPRLWYLMGRILADLGAYSEARLIYRQVLARLPMSCFGHVAHFNLACLQANQPGEAAKAGALRELKEFRRHCRGLRGLCVGGVPKLTCELCGAPQ